MSFLDKISNPTAELDQLDGPDPFVPTDTPLGDIIETFVAAGKSINPPEAARVLAESTAPEIAGKPEPPTEEQTNAEKLAVLNREREAKGQKALKKLPASGGPRRTGAVVQAELDIALARIAEIEKCLAAEMKRSEELQDQLEFVKISKPVDHVLQRLGWKLERIS